MRHRRHIPNEELNLSHIHNLLHTVYDEIKELRKDMATQGEKLQAAYNQFVKAKGEIIAKIAELQTAHNGEGVTDELVNSFVTLGQQLDDVVPDEIPTGDDGSTGSSDGSDTNTGSTGTDSGDAGSSGADSSTGSDTSVDPNADANAAGRPAKAE